MEKRMNEMKAIILTVALLVLAALLLGRFVAVPVVLSFNASIPVELFCGAGTIALVASACRIGGVIAENRSTVRRLRAEFPKNTAELRNFGVETPVDFTYAMIELLTLPHVSLLHVGFPHPSYCADRKVWEQSQALFTEMFGRPPDMADSQSWEIIAAAETARMLQIPLEQLRNLSEDTFPNLVTEKLRDYFETRAYEIDR